MTITKQIVAEKIADYLHHAITLEQLVDWAENAIMDGDFDDQAMDTVRQVTARLGVADVRAFGLTREDCEQALSELGYGAKVEIVAA